MAGALLVALVGRSPRAEIRIPSEGEIATAVFAAREVGDPYGAFTAATGEFELALRAQDCRFIGPISFLLFGPPKSQPVFLERGFVIVADGFELAAIEFPRSTHDRSTGEPTVDVGIVRLRPTSQQGAAAEEPQRFRIDP